MASKVRTVIIVIIGLALTNEIIGKKPKKIVNGSNAAITDYPAVVSIQRYGGHYCGGVFISRLHILTAAHCLSDRDYEKGIFTIVDKKELSVVSGTSNCNHPKYVHQIAKIDIHPGYTGILPDFLHDIGIITLTQEMIPDETQNVVGLPYSDVYAGTYGTVLGWGYLDEKVPVTSEILKMAPVVTLNNNECNQRTPTPIFKDQLCGFYNDNVGFCHGDSGGPLISGNKVIGVVSMSWKCGGGYPDVYTRVYSYLSWIYRIIRRNY